MAMPETRNEKPKPVVTPEVVCVAVSVNEWVPVCVGVPEITPAGDTLSPGGIAEFWETVQVTVAVGVKTMSDAEYGSDTDPSASDVDVNRVNGATVQDKVRTPMLPAES